VAGAWLVVLAAGGGTGWQPWLAAGCVVVASADWSRASGRARTDAAYGLVALVMLTGWALLYPRVGAIGTWDASTLALDLGVGLVAIWLFAGLGSTTALAERAIELDESAETLGGALALLFGDPSLTVGYRLAPSGNFVDDVGRRLAPVAGGRVATDVRVGSEIVGTVIHDPAVMTTEADREAVSVAVALAAERARLSEELRLRAAEVSQSTLRLIRAADVERGRLAERIAAGPGHRLGEAGRHVERVVIDAREPAELRTAVERAAEQLARCRLELASFAGGLGVPDLDRGLATALTTLVDGLPLAVELRVEEIECELEVARTAWFVCAEAVANVLKHAEATRLAIEVTENDGTICVDVVDDGRGGADPRGSGLAGLRDRVTALAGRFLVECPPTGGTRVRTELPRAVVR
jgi:signal transduction histidine kinase